MISFRFHVVSITAVFLAIAIGVVVGHDLRRRRRGRRPAQPDRLRRAEPRRPQGRRTTGWRASWAAPRLHRGQRATSPSPTGSPTCRCSSSRHAGVDEDVVERTARPGPAAGGIDARASSGSSAAGTLESDDDRAALAVDRRRRSPTTTPRTSGPRPGRPSVEELSRDAAERRPTPAVEPPARCSRPLIEAPASCRVDSLDDVDHDASPTWPAPARGCWWSPAPGPMPGRTPPVARGRGRGRQRRAASPSSPTSTSSAPEAPGRGEDAAGRRSPTSRCPTSSRRRQRRLRSRARWPRCSRWRRRGGGPVGHFGYGDGADGVLPAWTPP